MTNNVVNYPDKIIWQNAYRGIAARIIIKSNEGISIYTLEAALPGEEYKEVEFKDGALGKKVMSLLGDLAESRIASSFESRALRGMV